MIPLKRLICLIVSNRPTTAISRWITTTNGRITQKHSCFQILNRNNTRRPMLLLKAAKGNRLQSVSSDSGSLKGSTTMQASHSWSKTCGCCGLNTKGDQEFAEILKEELARRNISSNRLVNLPLVQGFQIKQMNGSSVVLERIAGDESILVKFNINQATLMQDVLEIDSEDNQSSSSPSSLFTSKLPILIEILKNDQKVIGLRCNVTDLEFSDSSSDFDHNEAPLEICELAIYNRSDDWNDNVYRISGYFLEEEFHNRLLRVLAERLVDQLFIEHLLEFANSYEHLMYVTFLEEMRSFLTCNQIN